MLKIQALKPLKISTLPLTVLIISYIIDVMKDDFNEIMANLSENARISLQKADYFSKCYNNGYMSTEHLLMGVLAQDTSTAARILSDED
ncbi:Clp protease N-terminal domain-containing protein, partial [Candidatus Saccharibacteria bacterium]|nr:Clp protease N-terminal domain-containing protein [Candidatus Saccharibacteria bacterium]